MALKAQRRHGYIIENKVLQQYWSEAFQADNKTTPKTEISNFTPITRQHFPPFLQNNCYFFYYLITGCSPAPETRQLAGVSGLSWGSTLNWHTINEHRQLGNKNKDPYTSNTSGKVTRKANPTELEFLAGSIREGKQFGVARWVPEIRRNIGETFSQHGRNTGHSILNILADSPNIAWYICHTIDCRSSARI